jgi:hypothetical protein
MKKHAVLFFLLGLLISTPTWACMPPPPGMPAIQIQARHLAQLIDSEVVQNAIVAEGLSVRIKALNLAGANQVVLTNGCQFNVVRDTSAASPGTCPELLPFKIVNSIGCVE